MKTSKVVISPNLIRLLIFHMALYLVESRDKIKDNCSGKTKEVLSSYHLKIFRDLELLHGILLPDDKDLGSLSLDDDEEED